VWIEKHTGSCLKVDTVFAHVLLSFGDVPCEVYISIIRVTRIWVKYVEIEEHLTMRIIQVNSRTVFPMGGDRVQGTRELLPQ
jgi:hypothetical protein